MAEPKYDPVLHEIGGRVHFVQADGHRVQVCGFSTGHVLRDVAFCDTPERADMIVRAILALRAAEAKPEPANG